MTDVVLVSMPFGPVFWPSLGLSLLKAGLAGSGTSVEIKYFTIAFAERVGEAFYTTIAMNGTLVARELPGEWIFSHALFEETESDVERYVEEILVRRGANRKTSRPVSPRMIARILRARERVPGFLDRCVEEIARARPRLVGFTSMFQQHVASLALARRLKEALPGVRILFGGANCEGVMGAETLRQFAFVDAVVSGEADLVFPELVRRTLAGEPLSDVPGVRSRDRLEQEFAMGRFPNAPSVTRLDELPYPDYADYFGRFRESRLDRSWQPGLFVETSRGCWWGERMHCTFCGLNGATMTYRSKSPRRAVDEMVALKARYPEGDIQVVDNILDLAYFKTLLPELADRGLDFGLFYETKSNLKKEQVRLLRRAGVHQIQPGIESFSDAVLKLMRKGVTGLHNVQLLKWCKEFGLKTYWNLLWGFPGEPAEEYESMAALVPHLTHLPAPNGFYGLRLDRFSPNFFDAEKLGFADVAPLPSYEHVYKLPKAALANLAYYFRYGYRQPQDPAAYVGPLLRALERWRRVQPASDLFSVDLEDGHLLVWDLRPGALVPLTALRGLERTLYQACDAASDLTQLAARSAAGEDGLTEAEIASRLQPLVRDGLMVQSGTRYLSLAVPLGSYVPSARVVDRFFSVAARLGRRTREGLRVPLERAGVRRTAPPTRDAGPRRRRARALEPRRFRVAHGELIVA